MTVHIGDIVERKPFTIGDPLSAGKQIMLGTVVYVHPRGRFHVVEFPAAKRSTSTGLTAGVRSQEQHGVRESFFE